MKIEVLKRCESGDMIEMKAKDRRAAVKLCETLVKDPHVLGAKLTAFVNGRAIINHVARFTPGAYTVPDEVGQELIKHKLAKKAA